MYQLHCTAYISCSWWWTNDSTKHVEPFNEKIKIIHGEFVHLLGLYTHCNMMHGTNNVKLISPYPVHLLFDMATTYLKLRTNMSKLLRKLCRNSKKCNVGNTKISKQLLFGTSLWMCRSSHQQYKLKIFYFQHTSGIHTPVTMISLRTTFHRTTIVLPEFP